MRVGHPTKLLSAALLQALAVVLLMAATVFLGRLNAPGLGAVTGDGSWAESPLLLAAIGAGLLAVLIGGGWMARAGLEPPEGRAGRWPRWLEWAGFGGLVLLAAGVRLYRLGEIPRWLDYDTSQNGWIAITLLEQMPTKGFQPVLMDWATGNEAAYLYLVGLSLKLFGVSVEALRLPSTMVGIFTVLAIYMLGRELYGPAVGLAAGFLAALVPWHLELSRMATRPVLTAFFVAVGLLLLSRALRAETGRGRWANLIACGASLGVGLHGYEAFRVFPLAIAASLVWVRLRQKRLGRGLSELVVVAGCAVVMTLPIFIYAYAHPEAYMEHVSTNNIIYEVKQSGSLAPILRNAWSTLSFFLFALPSVPNQDPAASAPLLLLTPLFLGGLMGLLLLLRRPEPEHRRARVLLLSTLAIMVVPFMLARYSLHSPRRYSGEMVPFYILAGAAAVGLLRTLRVRLGRAGLPAALLVAVVGAGALVSTIPTVYAGLDELLPKYRYPRAERVLRWALARTDKERVYLAPGLAGSSYLTRFFLKHPELNYLPTAWPLPEDSGQRDLLLVCRGAPWWDGLVRHMGATRKTVQLEMPRGHAPIRLTAYSIPRKELLKKRLTQGEGLRVLNGQLLVTKPGRYRLRPAKGGAGRVELDGDGVQIPDASPDLGLNLTAGLHSLEFSSSKGPARLEWRTPGTDVWTPLPPGRLWRLPAGAFPPGPQVHDSDLVLNMVGDRKIQADSAYQHLRELQDVFPAARGYLLLDLDRLPLKRWMPGKAPDKRAPYTYPDSYEHDPHKGASLARSPQGFFLLRRWEGQVIRFAQDGRSRGAVEVELDNPMDIAATGNTLLIADPGARAILAVEGGVGEPRPLIKDVLPVEVAAHGRRIAYLDQLRHQLVMRDLDDPELEERVHLGQVHDRMRLSISSDGTALVMDPVRGLQLMVDRLGRVLALHGDLVWLPRALDEGMNNTIVTAGHYHSGRREVVLCLQPDQVVRLGKGE